jgi:quercetin dioxygenase-like cupin family protein
MSGKTPVAVVQREAHPVVENPPGIFRTTLAWSEQSMLCHFRMAKGARIPLHDHPAVQNGYLISGRVRFQRAGQAAFVAVAGTGYCFASGEPHGAEVLEDAEAIECFTPARPEYAPD